MAESGIASRRNCEELIKQGLVKVNGKTAKLGDKADYEKDRIEVNGKPVKKQNKVYIILNKPKGILCSVKGEFGRKTVIDLVSCKEKIFPVGRLDFNTEGLLILTNDGDFANRIIHPSSNIKKTYQLTLDRQLTLNNLKRIKEGIEIEGRKVNIIDINQNKELITLSIHEGRKHIIRKVFDILGYGIKNLKRISIGNLILNLAYGEYKFVSREWLEKKIKE